MAGTQYLYADNTEWKLHPVSGACMIQVQYGGEALIHFGALPTGDATTYEGVMHQHLKQGEPFRYTGAEAIYCRAFGDNVSGIYQRAKVVCSPLVNV